jgi:prepilin-type processing-associated H-X9-DG protein
MFKIIGGDQKEYGPVSADQLREWIQSGRADTQTRVQAEGQTDWRALGELPEFADALAARSPTTPPPPVTTVPKTSGLAIASLVLGLLGLVSCGITSLVGLVLGIVALNKINKSQGRIAGNGLAIAGIIASGIFMLMLPIYAAMLLPALAKAKSRAQTIQCMNNVKQLALSAMMYANDQKGRLPDADRWCEHVQTYLGSGATSVLRCPAGNQSDRCNYAFNAKLSSVELNQVKNPAQTVLFVDSGTGWNKSGGPELLTQPSRHGKQVIVGFTDGHVEVVTSGRLNNLQWTP